MQPRPLTISVRPHNKEGKGFEPSLPLTGTINLAG
ncbi:hypothetical protein BCVP_CDS0016 [Bacillus phage BC-VP]|nr:hypothetical protein BCVP_CDS0016 [Bacillus phage BC-VP]